MNDAYWEQYYLSITYLVSGQYAHPLLTDHATQEEVLEKLHQVHPKGSIGFNCISVLTEESFEIIKERINKTGVGMFLEGEQ